MTSNQAAPAVAASAEVSTALRQLCATATGVLATHLDEAGVCVMCGCAWPCEIAVLAETNLAAL